MRVKLSLLITGFLAMSGCSDNHWQGPRRVKVIDGEGAGIANASVVIGNQAGLMEAYLTTDNLGEAEYYALPENATITATRGCYSPLRAWTYFFVNTTYQVNSPDLTVTLEACPASDSRQVAVTVTNTLAEVTATDITLGAITYSGPEATLDVESGLQDDGTVSVFASGYDEAGTIRGYGFALDQPAVAGSRIAVTLNRTDLSRHTHQLLNVPADAISYYAYASLLRRHGVTNLPCNFTYDAAPLPATVTTYAADSFSDNNQLGATVMLDRDHDGAPDANVGLLRYLPHASPQLFDFNATPAAPEALAYTPGAHGRPTLSWSHGDPRATVNTLTFSYRPPAPARSSSYYTLTAPGSATSLLFPELPDELAAFRPRGYANLSLQSLLFPGQISYVEYLEASNRHRGRFYEAEGLASYGYAAISRVAE